MKTASHGSAIGPSHANPCRSSDNLNSSMKMRLLRYARGTIKRLSSTVYTNKWPLSATDFVHVSDSIDPQFLDIEILLLPMTADFCHFRAIFRSLRELIIVKSLLDTMR
ncbi:hypothetical protein MRB53_014459 [Persea americana]|uniref:Uncharacterized protein n=1 Tax=Persea americana TaxID=3435 RepID=A0ACC2KB40_PERAE|nr:hypothetical protein MRB53_014459 [Persea americana]